MLDPRIYRMSLVLPALALLVLAFSLVGQPGARHSSLSPGAYDGGNVAASIASLQARFQSRADGSTGDAGLAGAVQRTLQAPQSGFQTTRDAWIGRTASGVRGLVNVIATRPGTSSEPAVLVVAPRSGPGPGGLAATATLEELGRVLGGETLPRTVVLASVDGVAGARRLAAKPPEPVDAVVVLGDLGSAAARGPVVLPWSGRDTLAPATLRNTVASAFSGQTGQRAGAPDLLGQLAHLAFPLSTTAQAPFLDRGLPAVELSLSGERGAATTGPAPGSGRLGDVGRAVLQAVTAIDDSGPVAAPSAYVVVSRQEVPRWAVALFVLALILPVLLTTLDGLARARRRRYPLGGGLRAVLAAALPFLVVGVVIAIGGVVGALPAIPDALPPGAVGPDGGAIAVMVVAALGAIGAGMAVRPLFSALLGDGDRDRNRDRDRDGTGADGRLLPHRARDARAARGDEAWAATAVATLLVLCAAAVAIWIADPFAAALLVPALHLWLWGLDSDVGLPAPVRGLLVSLGAVPVIGLVVFDAHLLGFDAPAVAWEAILLVSGHALSFGAGIAWSFALGGLASALVLVVARTRMPEPAVAAVSVRGPASYAGPGSLGGTKSALRR